MRHSTQAGYKTVLNLLAKEDFGRRRIKDVRLSDAKGWLIQLQAKGKGYSTIHSIRGVLRPAFQMAVDDELIRKNPFEFYLGTVVVNNSVTREAITIKQEKQYLDFVRSDRHFSRYYDTIYILFHTGLRISEFCGLTKDDIDFREGRLKVERQLHRIWDMRYIIEDTKTPSGVRYIPLTKEVAECFRHLLKNRKKVKVEPVVSDIRGKQYHGFLCLDKNGRPMVALHWEKYMQHIREKPSFVLETDKPEKS